MLSIQAYMWWFLAWNDECIYKLNVSMRNQSFLITMIVLLN